MYKSVQYYNPDLNKSINLIRQQFDKEYDNRYCVKRKNNKEYKNCETGSIIMASLYRRISEYVSSIQNNIINAVL